jgi:GAF domain-containing protein
VVAFTDMTGRLRAGDERRERDAILVEEQAALRRVAAVVAGGADSADVFAAVTEEVGLALGLPYVDMLRYEPDGSATVIGAWGERGLPTVVRCPIASSNGSAEQRGGRQLRPRRRQSVRPAPTPTLGT